MIAITQDVFSCGHFLSPAVFGSTVRICLLDRNMSVVTITIQIVLTSDVAADVVTSVETAVIAPRQAYCSGSALSLATLSLCERRQEPRAHSRMLTRRFVGIRFRSSVVAYYTTLYARTTS